MFCMPYCIFVFFDNYLYISVHTLCVLFLSSSTLWWFWDWLLSVDLPWNCLAFALVEFRCIAPHIRLDSPTGCAAIDGGMGTGWYFPSLCCLCIGRTSFHHAWFRRMRGGVPAIRASPCMVVTPFGACAAARNGAGRRCAPRSRPLPVGVSYLRTWRRPVQDYGWGAGLIEWCTPEPPSICPWVSPYTWFTLMTILLYVNYYWSCNLCWILSLQT